MMSLETHSVTELQFQEFSGKILVFLGNGGLNGPKFLFLTKKAWIKRWKVFNGLYPNTKLFSMLSICSLPEGPLVE